MSETEYVEPPNYWPLAFLLAVAIVSIVAGGTYTYQMDAQRQFETANLERAAQLDREKMIYNEKVMDHQRVMGATGK